MFVKRRNINITAHVADYGFLVFNTKKEWPLQMSFLLEPNIFLSFLFRQFWRLSCSRCPKPSSRCRAFASRTAPRHFSTTSLPWARACQPSDGSPWWGRRGQIFGSVCVHGQINECIMASLWFCHHCFLADTFLATSNRASLLQFRWLTLCLLDSYK